MVDILIIGAGPSGLSCSIEAKRAGLSTVILEKGSLVDYIRRFPTNLVWFSTPELLEIGNVPFVVSTVRPTRVDTLNYYQKVARQFGLDIRPHDAVVSIERGGAHFQVTTEAGKVYEAKHVVVSTGYFDNPNRLGVEGESLPNVLHYYNEPFDYFGCNVTVVGGRNSAVEAALDLYRHGARVTLVHRRARLSDGVKYWIQPDIENRIKAGEIKALWNATVMEMTPSGSTLSTPAGEQELAHDFAFVLIGYHPDTKLLQKFGVSIRPDSLAPEHNPQTLETHIPGLYVAGSVVAGKNNNKVFVENGRLHGSIIVKAILERMKC